MRYPFVMFDWGDTIMKDDPAAGTPMALWPVVEAIPGAEEVLRAIHGRRTIVMATGADQSDEAGIRLALRRVGLEAYFDHIFCFKNTGFRKPSEGFYCFILEALKTQPSDILMIGDSFESDVLGANRVGIPGLWLNRKDAEDRTGNLHTTIHRLPEVLSLLDETGQTR